MTTVRDEQVKELVREHYAEVARGAGSCCDSSCCAHQSDKLDTEAASGADGCCDSSCCAKSSKLYTAQEITWLPGEAVTASAGCGNPTALASLKPGETVVDFGSGGGIDCFLAARAVGPEGKVIGVDMTPDMVSLARKNASRLGLSNVEFRLAEMEHTPLPDGSTDALISNCVINLAPDKGAVFREAFRLLRPGGRAFISDMVLVEALPADAAADTDNWVACLSGAELRETYVGRMRSAGFVDVEVLSEVPVGNPVGWRSSVRSMNIRAFKPA